MVGKCLKSSNNSQRPRCRDVRWNGPDFMGTQLIEYDRGPLTSGWGNWLAHFLAWRLLPYLTHPVGRLAIEILNSSLHIRSMSALSPGIRMMDNSDRINSILSVTDPGALSWTEEGATADWDPEDVRWASKVSVSIRRVAANKGSIRVQQSNDELRVCHLPPSAACIEREMVERPSLVPVRVLIDLRTGLLIGGPK